MRISSYWRRSPDLAATPSASSGVAYGTPLAPPTRWMMKSRRSAKKSECRILRINSVDAAIIHDQLVPDFWHGGIEKAPYSKESKKSWQQFFVDLKAIDVNKDAEKLDNITFAELLEPYGGEVTAFFDNFGRNNRGAVTRDTPALIGAESVQWGGGLLSNRYTWPGGLGRISLALEAAIERTVAGR